MTKLMRWFFVGVVLISGSAIRAQGQFQEKTIVPEKTIESEITQKAESPKKAPEYEQGEQPFLWEVKSETAKVYLVGTIHVANKSIYPLHESLTKAFTESDKVAMEIVMDKQTEKMAGMKMLQAAAAGPGKTFRDYIDDDLEEPFIAKLKEEKIPVEAMQALKPWMIIMFVQLQKIRMAGNDTNSGIDKHFMNLAKEAQKPLLSLETVDMQVKAISSYTQEMNNLMVKSFLKADNTSSSYFDKMLVAWVKGDVEGLETMIHKEFNDKKMKPLYEAVFSKRNKHMAEKVVEYLKGDKTVFCMVGSGHLVGEGNVRDLLEAKGLKCTRLPVKAKESAQGE